MANTERPILFSGPAVRGILDGSKTQTRRVMKPQPNSGGFVSSGLAKCDDCGNCYPRAPKRCECGCTLFRQHEMDVHKAKSPYGVPGDKLWVRETWRPETDWLNPRNVSVSADIRYAADCEDSGQRWVDIPEAAREAATAMLCMSVDGQDKRRWHPSIHMPRWASRLTLEIVKVRVERLQDISEEDAKAEGYEWRGAFLAGEWANAHPDNPWVWVIEFFLQ